ncbi:MAG TPA: FkbM family methyltransferase [Verrucomicrobiae bacterium]|nr:FkbM family methyltransferase [Verrucomicrobiae bacterium]
MLRAGIDEFARRLVKRSLRRLGRPFACESYLANYLLARHLASLFRARNVKCVLDVGANFGQYASFLRDMVGYRGLIVSFEPVSECVVRLRDLAARDSDWVICDYALGAEDTAQEINVMKSLFFSSFLKPDDSLVKDFQTKNAVDRTESVRIRRLDSVIDGLRREHDLDNIYLKIDTQGYDMEVLKGAEAAMKSVVALQTEMTFLPLYHQATPFREAFEIVGAHGFELSGLFPVSYDSQMRLVEADCVFVKRGGPAEGLEETSRPAVAKTAERTVPVDECGSVK